MTPEDAQLIKDNTGMDYDTLHNYLRKTYGGATHCSNNPSHVNKRFQWALIKGRSYSKNISDYIQLCPSCHAKYDDTPQARENKRRGHLGQEPINRRRIRQIDVKNMKEHYHESVKLASKTTGISRTAIQNNLSGLSKNAGGYIWKYQVV